MRRKPTRSKSVRPRPEPARVDATTEDPAEPNSPAVPPPPGELRAPTQVIAIPCGRESSSTVQSDPAILPLAPSPARDRAIEHFRRVTAGVYSQILASTSRPGSYLQRQHEPAARALHRQLAPRDADEELLISTLLTTHARITQMSMFGVKQKNIDWYERINLACDRAITSYCRLLSALDAHRNPPRPTHVTKIRHANIAQQQVVQSDPPRPPTQPPPDLVDPQP